MGLDSGLGPNCPQTSHPWLGFLTGTYSAPTHSSPYAHRSVSSGVRVIDRDRTAERTNSFQSIILTRCISAFVNSIEYALHKKKAETKVFTVYGSLDQKLIRK
ncbi:hypothetical protein KIN20_030565 [Parelaphostrongylus tenuis]|uniref:Uncharacterized protein n=1 Tax=Parelaphostrongylus tenuis TaxID=148309 RepID=A0AAD5R3W5_PARTN|nr:hypothetical protein KIN20_030565 [Parelaphostrongylus tenuis]